MSIAIDTRREETPSAQGSIREPDVPPTLIDRAAQRPSWVASLASILAYRELIRNLVLKDLKLKYRGSVLGFLWSLVNPLAMVGVYTLAFKYILGVRQPGFPFFILLGVMAWTFFANSAMLATGALIEGGSLVKAVRFPRAILPLASGFFKGHIQSLGGGYIPFAKTKAERLAAADPRPSLEERYVSHDAYVTRVKAAAARLVTERFLLQDDADRLIAQAERSDVLR